MTIVYIDADGCPVKDEAVRVADRHGVPAYFVSNSWMRLPEERDVNRIVVSDAFDAADDWIEERAGVGDIVITNDIQLAEKCLNHGAQAISAAGSPFTADGIGMALAMRALSSDLRAMGEITGGQRPFSKKDRSRFLEALELAIRRAPSSGG